MNLGAITQQREYERIDDIKELRYGFVTGAAGRGKTEVIKEILRLNPGWGILTATTGVKFHRNLLMRLSRFCAVKASWNGRHPNQHHSLLHPHQQR